ISALRLLGSGRSFIVSENHLARQATIRGEVSGRMLRSSRYKYVCHDGGKNPEQLFDMKDDPGEMRSLISDPGSAAILAEHRDLLRRHLRDTGDSFQMPSLGN
ncbi:MAG: hypothetical protein JNM63_14325, partial [Spirochaetia bacterium]|nr:hypothetical protein [Spirochaetia bacterium]